METLGRILAISEKRIRIRNKLSLRETRNHSEIQHETRYQAHGDRQNDSCNLRQRTKIRKKKYRSENLGIIPRFNMKPGICTW